MINEILASVFGQWTLYMLIAGMGIFGALAIWNRNPRSFQFQMFFVFIILVVSEFIEVITENMYVRSEMLEHLGEYIHLLSMAGLAIVFWFRFYHASQSRKKLVDEIES